jgi:hypothetical protein
MKNISKFLIIATLCGSAQASFEMKARIGGGIVGSTNAKMQKPVLELDEKKIAAAFDGLLKKYKIRQHY